MSTKSKRWQFSQRCVGVELEFPQYDEVLEEMSFEHCWEITEDGSIPSSGRELVSPPMQGAAIPTQIRKVYALATDAAINTEHASCGTHVHVDVRDLYEFAESHGDTNMIQDRITDWGMVVSCLSRLFVGPGRNGTRFARGGFAIRDSCECDPGSLKKSRRIDYPTLAIREQTFEFRIFPSTKAANYTVARAAFCQASVDWLMANIDKSERAWKRGLNILSRPITSGMVFKKPETLDRALSTMGLDGEILSTLMRITARFLEGNVPVLPTIWEREREMLLRQTAQRKKFLTSLETSFEVFSTPEYLETFMREQLALT